MVFLSIVSMLAGRLRVAASASAGPVCTALSGWPLMPMHTAVGNETAAAQDQRAWPSD